MHRLSPAAAPPAQIIADKVFSALDRFLHVEAVSGIVLLLAAICALAWANSSYADSYVALWHIPVTLSVGSYSISHSLHFLINDGLMTIFFLVVGMEVRREIHQGALENPRVAALPFAAAFGGIVVPAGLFLLLVNEPALKPGWAVPTATDIAFAVGVLALLGKFIPASVRVFLLALAIIDDIAAVVIIAFFYSADMNFSGLLFAGAGVLAILGLQRIGIGSALAYVIPGTLVWFGLLRTGVHPTLAGVVLGLLTPVQPRAGESPVEVATRALHNIDQRAGATTADQHSLVEPAKQLQYAQRELLPPVLRVQRWLHPWVAYVIMPLFALANAGVNVRTSAAFAGDLHALALAVGIALVIGKPVGILAGSWLVLRTRWCQLPVGMTWKSMTLVGCLGGIGFTMSIFIATLAFHDDAALAAAKIGVLCASAIAGALGLLMGFFVVRTRMTG